MADKKAKAPAPMMVFTKTQKTVNFGDTRQFEEDIERDSEDDHAALERQRTEPALKADKTFK